MSWNLLSAYIFHTFCTFSFTYFLLNVSNSEDCLYIIFIYFSDFPLMYCILLLFAFNGPISTWEGSLNFHLMNLQIKSNTMQTAALAVVFIATLAAWLSGWQGLSAGPPLWWRLKYLSNHLMRGQSKCLWHFWFEWNISKPLAWAAMKIGAFMVSRRWILMTLVITSLCHSVWLFRTTGNTFHFASYKLILFKHWPTFSPVVKFCSVLVPRPHCCCVSARHLPDITCLSKLGLLWILEFFCWRRLLTLPRKSATRPWVLLSDENYVTYNVRFSGTKTSFGHKFGDNA